MTTRATPMHKQPFVEERPKTLAEALLADEWKHKVLFEYYKWLELKKKFQEKEQHG